MPNANFHPVNARSLRLQVQNERGDYLTVLEVPRCLPDDDGTMVEAFYWKPLLDSVQKHLFDSPSYALPLTDRPLG